MYYYSHWTHSIWIILNFSTCQLHFIAIIRRCAPTTTISVPFSFHLQVHHHHIQQHSTARRCTTFLFANSIIINNFVTNKIINNIKVPQQVCVIFQEVISRRVIPCANKFQRKLPSLSPPPPRSSAAAKINFLHFAASIFFSCQCGVAILNKNLEFFRVCENFDLFFIGNSLCVFVCLFVV